MKKSLKLILWGTAALALLLAVTGVLAAQWFGREAAPRFEAAASKALGMDVTVDGSASIRFLPRTHVKVVEVHARQHGVEVASAAEVGVAVELWALLRKQVRVKGVVMKRPKIDIVRRADGKLNIEHSTQVSDPGAARTLASLRVTDGNITYRNEVSGAIYSSTGCDADIKDLNFADLSYIAQLSCAESRALEFDATKLKLTAVATGGIVIFEPVTMHLLGGEGSGRIRADYSATEPVYQVNYQLENFRIEEFFKAVAPNAAASHELASGAMHFTTNLTLRGSGAEALRRSATGEANLHGEGLTLAIGDLDKKFARYETSQNFNLVDVGAFFFAGPLGVGVTKGYDFARILEHADGHTAVPILVSKWRVEHGVAQATDVAMATPKNRLALRGRLNFVTGRFDDVTIALVDADGCARVEQKIHGPFRKPDVSPPNALRAITGPALRLLQDAGELLGVECDSFYTGSVAAPTASHGRLQ
jgi:uncharacterized protein involved in outer membrane biogenesis